MKATPANLDKSSVQHQSVDAEVFILQAKSTAAESVQVPLQTVNPVVAIEPVKPEPENPSRVFCGSPKQGNWKTINVANANLGQELAKQHGWTGSEWTALLELWSCESGFNHLAINPDSGAGGIPQSWPASKMATVGSDWQTNPVTQMKWGIGYLIGVYGKPSVALQFHYQNNWY